MTTPLRLSKPEPSEAEVVTYRVLPQGCGRIYSGAFDSAANCFTTLKKGETATAPRAVAQALEARGFAEIQ